MAPTGTSKEMSVEFEFSMPFTWPLPEKAASHSKESGLSSVLFCFLFFLFFLPLPLLGRKVEDENMTLMFVLLHLACSLDVNVCFATFSFLLHRKSVNTY